MSDSHCSLLYRTARLMKTKLKPYQSNTRVFIHYANFVKMLSYSCENVDPYFGFQDRIKFCVVCMTSLIENNNTN